MTVPYFDYFNQASTGVGSYADQSSGGVKGFANDLTQGLDTWKNSLSDKVNDFPIKVDDITGVVDDLGPVLEDSFSKWGDSINSAGNNIKEFSNAVEDYKGGFISNIDDILVKKGWMPDSLYPVGKIGLVIILGILWPVIFTFFLWVIGGGSVIPVTSRMIQGVGAKAMSAGPMITNFASTVWEHRDDVIDAVAGRSMDLNSLSSIMTDIDKAIRKYE